MTFDQFKQRFGIRFSEPKTVKPGTQRVMFNVMNVFLIDKQTGTYTATKLAIDEPASEEALLLQIYSSEY